MSRGGPESETDAVGLNGPVLFVVLLSAADAGGTASIGYLAKFAKSVPCTLSVDIEGTSLGRFQCAYTPATLPTEAFYGEMSSTFRRGGSPPTIHAAGYPERIVL